MNEEQFEALLKMMMSLVRLEKCSYESDEWKVVYGRAAHAIATARAKLVEVG